MAVALARRHAAAGAGFGAAQRPPHALARHLLLPPCAHAPTRPLGSQPSLDGCRPGAASFASLRGAVCCSAAQQRSGGEASTSGRDAAAAAAAAAKQQLQQRPKKQRLDDYCLGMHPEYSKNLIQSWIVQGKVLVNDR